MKFKIDALTVIGIAGTVLAFVGQALNSHASEKKADATIAEKVATEVAKQLSNKQ